MLLEIRRIGQFKGLYGEIRGFRSTVGRAQSPDFVRKSGLRETPLRTRGSGVRIPSGALFIKKAPRLPWPRDRNEQIEPLTDNKTVRLPGAAPGRTSPLLRRRSGAKRRTSGAAASNPSGRSIQIWSKPPISWLDGQLGGRPYIVIRQLVKVRTVRMSALMIWYCRKF